MTPALSEGGTTMTTHDHASPDGSDGRGLGVRLDEIGWALFLIMTGALWLTPGGWAPRGSWLAGLGLILLGLNGTRRFCRLHVSPGGLAAGGAALVAGVGQLLGGAGLFIPVLLVAVGIVLATRTISQAMPPAVSR
jgi:hypothetical protein